MTGWQAVMKLNRRCLWPFRILKFLDQSCLAASSRGDVVVEITIDAQGTVVDERLLQGLGHGVDDRVIAVLRDWRFHPATRNGVAIQSTTYTSISPANACRASSIFRYSLPSHLKIACRARPATLHMVSMLAHIL